MFELIDRDYFLSALDDPQLHIRVLDQQPKTLDECLVKATQMEAFSKSVQSSSESRGSSKGVEAIIQEEEREKRVRLVTPICESEIDNKIIVLEEFVEKQDQVLKKSKQASKSASKENIRPSHVPPDNASPPQVVYVPCPSIPFSSSYVTNGGSVGQYPQKCCPELSGIVRYRRDVSRSG